MNRYGRSLWLLLAAALVLSACGSDTRQGAGTPAANTGAGNAASSTGSSVGTSAGSSSGSGYGGYGYGRGTTATNTATGTATNTATRVTTNTTAKTTTNTAATTVTNTGTASTTQAATVDVTLSQWKVELAGVSATTGQGGSPVYSLPAGKVTFRVKNTGSLTHGFEIKGSGLDMKTADLAPGESASLTVTLAGGSYEIWCPVDGHKDLGMDGTIQVH